MIRYGRGRVRTDHGLIIEYHAITCTKSSSGGREVCIDQKRLAPHFWGFGGHNIDKLAIGGKEGVELRADFVFVDFVIEIVDVKGRVGLSAICHGQ